MKHLKIYILLLALPCLALQCNKDKDDPDPDNGNNNNKEQLPPATQSGENTFGCLVNGKVWRPENNNQLESSLKASFGLGRLDINAQREIPEQKVDQHLNIYIYRYLSNVKEYSLGRYNKDSIKYLNFANFWDDNTGCWFYTTSDKKNYLKLTRLDSVENIVSGRFEFTAVNDSCGDVDTIRVTKGRFDIKYAH